MVVDRGNKKCSSCLPVVGFPFRLRGYVDIHLWTSRTEQRQTTFNRMIWPIMYNSSSHAIVKIPPLSGDPEWLLIAVLHHMVSVGTSFNQWDHLPVPVMETPRW